MHHQWTLLSFIFSFIFFSTAAQQTPDNYSVLDWSFGFFNSKPSDIDHIRGDVATFYAENSNKGLACISFRGTTSLKFEMLRLNGRISMGTGIRFSEFVQNMGKWDLLTEGANYFYFLYRQDDQNTYYARVKSIIQSSSYLGLPIEFSFFPFENLHLYRLYLKIGAEVDFRLNTDTNVNFKSYGMDYLDDQVASHISKPSAIGFSMYNCVGIRAGAAGKTTFSIELLIPLFNANPGSPGLLRNGTGGGVQFSYHVPIQPRDP